MSENHVSFLKRLFGEHKETRKKIFHSFKAKANAQRTFIERFADYMTAFFGSISFLVVNMLLFIVWILVNTNRIRGIPPFDPFPFNLLTTFVSLEAIILAVFVLVSQNRVSKVDDLREETHLQLNLIAEKEITKIMKMMSLLLEKHGIDLSQDPELKEMIRPISEEEIEKK